MLRMAAGGDGHAAPLEFCYFVIHAVAWTWLTPDRTGGVEQICFQCRPSLSPIDRVNTRAVTPGNNTDRIGTERDILAGQG
jgi:hypothetical protein